MHGANATTNTAEVSVFALANVLLTWRRTIVLVAFIGAVIGLTTSLMHSRVYASEVTFIPQGSEGSASSNIALAASQFGFRLPTSGGTWSPAVYVELVRSRALLESIALDTVTVVEHGKRRMSLMDLLEVKDPNPAVRLDRTVHKVEEIVQATQDKALGTVKVVVATKWPSVSLTLAQQLIAGVNRFNFQTRKSQATAERQFVEVQVQKAESALRLAENRSQVFLQANRTIGGSPGLAFERDRLQRDVMLRQEMYTSLLRNYEEARAREVRDIPVVTVIEEPRLAVLAKPRGTLVRTLVGGVFGLLIGIVIAGIARLLARARQDPNSDTQEFFRLVHEALPRFLTGKRQ